MTISIYKSVSEYRYHRIFGLSKWNLPGSERLDLILSREYPDLASLACQRKQAAMQADVSYIQTKGRFIRGLYWLFNIDDYAYKVTLLRGISYCQQQQNTHNRNEQASPTMYKIKQLITDIFSPAELYAPESANAQQWLMTQVDGSRTEAGNRPSSERQATADASDQKTVRYDHQVRFLAVLGFTEIKIGDDVSLKAIKRAYKKKLLELHPDKNRTDENAHASFIKLQESYENIQDWFKGEIGERVLAEWLNDIRDTFKELNRMQDIRMRQMKEIMQELSTYARRIMSEEELRHLNRIGMIGETIGKLALTVDVVDFSLDTYAALRSEYEGKLPGDASTLPLRVSNMIESVEYLVKWFSGCDTEVLLEVRADLEKLQDEIENTQDNRMSL